MNDLDKDINITRNLIAIAKRGRKGKSANIRSKMLKMIMPHLSHENGEKLAQAIDKNNAGAFANVWEQIKKEIKSKLETGKNKSHSSAAEKAVPLVMNLKNRTINSLNTEEFLDEMRSMVIKEMESTSSSNSFHNYGNVLLGKGHGETIRELIANGTTLLEGKAGDYLLEINTIKKVKDTKNMLLRNIEFEVCASLYDTEKNVIREFKEKGCLAVASTEIAIKALTSIE